MKYLLTLLSLVFAIALNAQQSTLDVVDLHNGTRYQGQITHFEYGKLLTIRLLDGSEVTLGDKEIKRIRYAETGGEQTRGKETNVKAQPSVSKADWKSDLKVAKVKRRFRPFLSLIANGGKQPRPTGFFFNNARRVFGFGIEGLVYYELKPWLHLGAGAAFDRFNTQRGESVISGVGGFQLLPLPQKNVSFTVGFMAGYGNPIKTAASRAFDVEGGLLMHPSLGLRIGRANEIFYTIDLGYRIINTKYMSNTFQGLETRINNYRRFSLRLGTTF